MSKLKKKLYFIVASYFRFWARFVFERWQPQIVVVTGSNGKTTLLHLIESQLGNRALYSHKANSAFGVPFHVLGLERKKLAKTEWLKLLILAPIRSLRKLPSQDIYIVEADCDRPGEGKFLAEFLRPEITLWVSSDRTHSESFDSLVASGMFDDIDSAIAHEYGWFAEHTSGLVILKDQPNMIAQLSRTKARTKTLSLDQLKTYKLNKSSTRMETKKGSDYTIPAIIPKEAFVQVGMTHMLCRFMALDFDNEFKDYYQPPGRSSVFEGKKGFTIFDSSYNSNFASVEAALATFADYPGREKWVIVGDMIDQGEGEKAEHVRLAQLIASYNFKRIILMGPRVKRYTKPALRKLLKDNVTLVAFEKPKPVLDYINQEANGSEVIFFKGARWLEGVIKNLLAHEVDESKLCRREDHYQKIREKWGVG